MTDPKLTPREPTPSMVEAGLVWTDFARGVWRAMHDAAPTVEADATPELLKAVRSVIAWYEAEDDHSKADFYKRLEMCRESETLCRAAIAKAEGHPAAQQPAALPELSDAEILRIAESVPDKDPTLSQPASWGHGFRENADGKYMIPNVLPYVTVAFARAVIEALKVKQ